METKAYNRFHLELLKLVDDRIAAEVEKLLNRVAIKSIEDYRYSVGVIDGLKLIQHLGEDAISKINEE